MEKAPKIPHKRAANYRGKLHLTYLQKPRKSSILSPNNKSASKNNTPIALQL